MAESVYVTITRYDVEPGAELTFEAGVEISRPLFARQSGYEALELERSNASPGRYWLRVAWREMEGCAEQMVRMQLQLDDLLNDCLRVAPGFERCVRVIAGSCTDPLPAPAARNEGLDIYRLVARPAKPFDTQRRPDIPRLPTSADPSASHVPISRS